MAFRTAFTNTGDTNNPAVTVSGISAGEILIYGISNDNSGASATFPTGFSQITGSPRTITNDGQRLFVARKVADGTEGVLTTTLTTSGGWSAFVAVYTGRDTTNPINGTPTVAGSNAANSSPVTTNVGAVTTTIDGCDILHISCLDSSVASAGASATPPSGYDERVDLYVANLWSNITLADLVQATLGSTGTVGNSTAFTSGNAGWGAFLLALAPAASAAALSYSGAFAKRRTFRPRPFAPGNTR